VSETTLHPHAQDALDRMAVAMESQAESLAAIAEAVSHPARIVLGPNQKPSEVTP
jgi:hypothetical protein